MNKELKDTVLILTITLIAGTLVRLPEYVSGLSEIHFFPRNIPLIVLTAMTAVLILQGKFSRKSSWIILSVIGASFVFINVMPFGFRSQTGELAMIHLPLFTWLMLCVSVQGKDETRGQMLYLRLNGELLMIVPIFLIGGVILCVMMAGLFDLIDMNIEEFIEEYAFVYGTIGSILVALFLTDKLMKNSKALAPVIAQLFMPLLLVFMVVYLVAMVVARKNPYHDRDFLIVFNGLMVLILGIVVFSISGRQNNRWTAHLDWLNIALVILTLTINTVALSAILFRLASFGLTPNRVTVLGANILIFIHLTGIVIRYINVVRGRTLTHELENWICQYFRIYLVWTGCVTFIFPIIFFGYVS